jgi:hypothetical protein
MDISHSKENAMEPEEFLTQVALQVREIFSQKGEKENFKPKEERGLVFSKGAAMPLEIPPDIKKVHQLFQEKFKTTYLKDGRIENQNNSNFQQVAEEVLKILEKSQIKKSAGFGATLSVGGSANKKFDDAYNTIVKLRDQFKDPAPSNGPKANL